MNPDSEYKIPSLIDLCFERIFKNGVQSMLRLYSLSSVIDQNEWKQLCLKYISDRYPTFLEKYGEETLREVIDLHELEKIQQSYQSRLKAERRLSIKGTVLDPQQIEISPSESVDGYYPLRALIAGVLWPSDVVPTRREEYLSPTEFFQVFGMTKEDFGTKDKYIRIRLKKEKGLF